MRAPVVILTAVISGLLAHPIAAAADPAADAKVVAQATAGRLKALRGESSTRGAGRRSTIKRK